MSTLSTFLNHLVVRPPLVLASGIRSLPRLYQGKSTPLMAAHESPATSSPDTVQFSPAVNKLQEFVHSDPSDGWERCWEEGLTPWDLGKPTPIIQHLLQTGSVPMGRALVPGCGSGYDVVTLASSERYVIGLDISEVAINKARQTFSLGSLRSCLMSYLITPWAACMRRLLKPDGELITLMFPVDDHDGGPPYKVSVADYEEVLHPLGFHAVSVMDNELAVTLRKGREKLGRWRRTIEVSQL